jgi:ATP-dependent RNA helicase RhlE
MDNHPASFEVLNLTAPLLNALHDLGFTAPTPIQQKAFSVIMSGRDVTGVAQTGTGKTFAYLLPILRQISFSDARAPRVLIIVPTRELVIQLAGEIEKLAKYMTTVRIAGVYGGTNINTQKNVVMEGLDIVVGTPGRVRDLSLSGALPLSNIRQLVIDEVDEMLSLGFRSQLTHLFDMLPARRQNLLFSATMTEEVDAIIQEFFNGPVFIEATRAGTPLAKIQQNAYEAPNFHTKINLLQHLLATDERMTKVLVFTPSKRMADLVYEKLEAEFPNEFDVVHSNKSQNFRINAVAAFDKGVLRGLISTDLLARGLDVTDVTHVISMDTPEDAETYIHRIGRTGRADTEGAALLFVTETDAARRTAIETLMRKAIPTLPLPEAVEISMELTMDELEGEKGKNILRFQAPPKTQGAFHEKLEKNKKVNKGNKTKYLREKKYKKPIKKRRS